MRVAVIGGGLAGCAAARCLARTGQSVTVFEQFTIDHDRGSSFGPSRIIRRTYPDADYTHLMNEAYRLWDELEEECGETLRISTGGIYFGPADHPDILAILAALDSENLPYEKLDAGAAMERFPSFRFQSHEIVIYQEDTGILLASRCVRAFADSAALHGAELRENCPVALVARGDAQVLVTTTDGTQPFDAAVITAGPWTKRFVPEAPLTVTLQEAFFVPSGPDTDSLPVWIDAETFMYGFPSHDGAPGVKVGQHFHGPEVDPSSIPNDLTSNAWDRILEYLRNRLPELDTTLIESKRCLYTNTPDDDFLIDRVPGLPGAVFASACSGHGFKFGPLTGKALADMVMRNEVGPVYVRFRLRW